MPSHGLRLTLVLLFLVATSVVACESQDYTPNATMQTMPESNLAPFPNATLLSQGAFPRRQSLEEGTTDAHLVRKFGTSATEAEVIAYYASVLGPLGWTCHCPECSIWVKPGYRFEIGTLSPGSLASSERGYQFVYNEIFSEVRTIPSSTA